MRIANRGRNCTAAAVVLAVFFFCLPVAAQTDRAEVLFAEAKSLAASTDTTERAIAKFEEAASLFKAAGDKVKVSAVELEHGRALRTLAARELAAKRYDESRGYLDRALTKFRAVGSTLDTAYVYHDLGYLSGQRGKSEDSIPFYILARDNYRAAGDRSGEAIVLRNIGLIHYGANRPGEASRFFDAALQIRIATGDHKSAALLYVDLGDVDQSIGDNVKALAWFTEALQNYRLGEDRDGEAMSLVRLGTLQSTLYKFSDAIANISAALKIFESAKDEMGQAETASTLGAVLMSAGKNRDAESHLLMAAKKFEALKQPGREGSVLINLAINYQALNRLDEARATMQRSVSRFLDAKSELGEAYARITYAELLSYINLFDEALIQIRTAEKLFRVHDPDNVDRLIARALATQHQALSNHGEAIRYWMQALDGAVRSKSDARVAGVLVDLANSYSKLGQNEKSIEFTRKALEIAKKMGSQYMESVALSNLGYDHLLLEKFPEAKDYFQKAIVIMRANGYEREEGYAVHNLGLLYYKQKQYQQALTNYDRAIILYRQTGDRRPESFVYDSYGELYRDLGQHEKAIENLQKAIVLAREIRYKDVEAQALGNMMTLWSRRKQPRLAVLYGKQAVNLYQSIRAGAKTLDKAAQKSFVQSNEKTYRQLANVLIEEGRLAEAQQVLDLLKAEEYFEFVRRDSAEADDHAALALNETERAALQEYSRVSSQLTSIGAAFQALQDKRIKAGGKLPATDEAEYLKLKTQVESAGEGLKTFFAKLASEFSKKVEDGTVVTPQSIETLKADLRRAGADVVLVSTYLLPDRYRAIVTTGRAMVDRKVEYSSVKLTGADINRKIFEFQRALQNPRADTRKLGKELYDIFVKPLEGDLKGAGAKTILWSLDGSLRYIPMAALSPDGKTYLAEQYQNVVVTLGRQTNLFAKPGTDEWRAIGAGVSKEHTGFSALPSVPAEIGSIVKDQGVGGGVLDGTRLLDEQFNLESLRNTVPQQTEDGKPFNVLHLATHFSLGANDQDSALLLGDGTRLSLFAIGKDEALDFKDVELLTLSACQTGVSTGDANGREVESLGMLAQKKGAKAVLATLWKVADESTSLFMSEFYRIKKDSPTMNKSEAIRLAQKAMIDGRIKASGTSNTCRAETFASGAKKDDFKCDPNAPFSHPYFWSPFVLIGNWR